MAKFWYPKTCSEDQGCIIEIDGTTMSGLSKTCHGHAPSWGRSIGIPAFNGLTHNAAITGDQAVCDTIITQNRAGTEQGIPTFQMIDELRIGDLTSVGIDPILVIYENSLFASGANHENACDPAFLATAFTNIKNANPGVTRICIDQETWWENGIIPSTKLQYYVDLVNIAKQYWPDVGIYSSIPERYANHLNYPIGHATYLSRLANWEARCSSNQALFDVVNTVYPSLYYIGQTATDRTKRDVWIEQNIDICRELAPGKPILPFIWPRVHQSVDPTMPYVDGTYYRADLNKIKSYGADGVVLWLESADVDPRTLNPVPAWWTETLDFIADEGL